MYKALITDLDGTSVTISSNGSDIDLATQEAVRTAIRAGKKLTCATGREWELTKDIIKKLGFISPCIIEGGTRIINPITEENIWEKAFDTNVPSRVLEVFKSKSKSGMIMHSQNTNRQALADVDALPESLRFLYLLAVKEEIAVEICNQINIGDYATAHITPSWEGDGLVDIHVTHPEATKEHAIQIWQKLENITKEETIGMGDSGNDMPIFQSSGLKIAVGNATDNLKGLADYIAPPVNEKALKYVIDTILLV